MTYKALAGAALTLALFVPASGRAQQTKPVSPTPKSGASTTKSGQKQAAKAKQEPCWKQVGISQSVMDQRKSIHENVMSQVKGVCADSSLTQQQKMAKIKEIHQQAHEQSSALLTPQQEEALKQCQRERSGGGGGAHHPGVAAGHPADPCAQ